MGTVKGGVGGASSSKWGGLTTFPGTSHGAFSARNARAAASSAGVLRASLRAARSSALRAGASAFFVEGRGLGLKKGVASISSSSLLLELEPVVGAAPAPGCARAAAA